MQRYAGRQVRGQLADAEPRRLPVPVPGSGVHRLGRVQDHGEHVLDVPDLPVLALDNVARTDARAVPIEAVSADAIDGASAASVAPPPTSTEVAAANAAALAPTSTRAAAPTTSVPRAATTAKPQPTIRPG